MLPKWIGHLQSQNVFFPVLYLLHSLKHLYDMYCHSALLLICAVFTGHPYDTVLDIYFAEARFYDAKHRQWMASDPIKSGLNWYLYVEGNLATYHQVVALEAVVVDDELPVVHLPGMGGLGVGLIGTRMAGRLLSSVQMLSPMFQ